MSLWHGHDPRTQSGEPAGAPHKPEAQRELTALAFLLAVLFVARLLGGERDHPSDTPPAPEDSPPALMYDVRRALEQMSRQA